MVTTPFDAYTATEFGLPGTAASPTAVYGLLYRPFPPPSGIGAPAVFFVRFTWQIAPAPSSPTNNCLPSLERASRFGSLPTEIVFWITPVRGSMATTELPRP